MAMNSIPSEDLIKILEIFIKQPEKGRDILSKLKEGLKSGLSVSELIIKLYEIGKELI